MRSTFLSWPSCNRPVVRATGGNQEKPPFMSWGSYWSRWIFSLQPACIRLPSSTLRGTSPARPLEPDFLQHQVQLLWQLLRTVSSHPHPIQLPLTPLSSGWPMQSPLAFASSSLCSHTYHGSPSVPSSFHPAASSPHPFIHLTSCNRNLSSHALFWTQKALKNQAELAGVFLPITLISPFWGRYLSDGGWEPLAGAGLLGLAQLHAAH